MHHSVCKEWIHITVAVSDTTFMVVLLQSITRYVIFYPNNKAILDDYYNPNCIRIVFVAVLEYITHQKSGCKIQPLVSPPHSFSHERESEPAQ